MGGGALLNMLHIRSSDHTTNPRMRRCARLIGHETASADATEGRPFIDDGANILGVSQANRPPHENNLADYPSTKRPRAIDLKGLLEKLFSHSKRALPPTARNLDYPPLCLPDSSAGDAPLAIQPRDRSRHTSGQDGFKSTLQRCVNILGEPVKEADGWSKLSNPAGEYFDLIATSTEDRLIRLRTWAFDDITIQDPEFGDSSPSNLMEYLINIVKGIMSAIEEVRKEMDILGTLASEGAVEQTGNEIEIADFLSDQESDEEKKMERFDYCLERRQHLVGLAVEL